MRDREPLRAHSIAETLRVATLGALLLAAAGAMWAWRGEALAPEAAAPPPASALPAPGAASAPDAPPLTGMMDPDPVEPYAWNAAEALAEAKDGSEELPAKALAYLLHTARSTPADAKARVEAPRATASELAARSAARRGAWVRVRGAVWGGFYEPAAVPWSGPTGVYRVYANFVYDEAGSALVLYTVKDAPPLSAGDIVAACGLYLQTRTYRTREGARAAAPVVVADALVREEPAPRASFVTSYVIPGLLAAAGLVLLAAFLAPRGRSSH
jgi:hypothetical protein